MTTRRQFVKSTLAAAAASVAAPAFLNTVAKAQSAPAVSPAFDASPDVKLLGAAGIAPKGTIDWHNHWISPRSAAILATIDSSAFKAGAPGAPAPSAPRAGSTMLLDIDRRIAHLDQVGVERQVICWATTMGWDAVLTPEQAKPLWSTFNDDLAEVVRKHPTRFSGYAVVPTSDIDWAATELDRAYRDLGLIGVVLPVGAFQTLEGARHVAPIVEVTQKHNGILYLHSGPAYPTVPGQRVLHSKPDDAPGARYDLEWAATYARGVVTLTQTKFLDDYPDVTVQIAMLGGQTPFLFQVLKTHPYPDGAADPIERLRRVYLDASTTRAPHTLELAVHTIGADRILFGSDFGAVPTVATTIAAVHASPLSSDEQQRIFVDNGMKLFSAKGKQIA